MAVGRFAPEQVSAREQIAADGERSTYEVIVSTPQTGKEWRSTGPTVQDTRTVNAVWLDYRERQIDGQQIKRGDQRVLVPALDLVGVNPSPSTDYLTRVDGTRWKVKDVKILQPNEDRILMTLQCRKVRP